MYSVVRNFPVRGKNENSWLKIMVFIAILVYARKVVADRCQKNIRNSETFSPYGTLDPPFYCIVFRYDGQP